MHHGERLTDEGGREITHHRERLKDEGGGGKLPTMGRDLKMQGGGKLPNRGIEEGGGEDKMRLPTMGVGKPFILAKNSAITQFDSFL